MSVFRHFDGEKQSALPALPATLSAEPSSPRWMKWGLAATLMLMPMAHHATADIIGPDDRMTFNAFAKKHRVSLDALKAAFGATGSIVCPEGSGTAQLTAAPDVITTAAHMFFGKDCRPRADSDRCYFQPLFVPQARYQIDFETLATGTCGGGPHASKLNGIVADGAVTVTDSNIGMTWVAFQDFERAWDWAIVELKQTVDGIQPYPIPDLLFDPNMGRTYETTKPWMMDYSEIEVGHDLVHVSAGDSDLEVPTLTTCKYKGWFEGAPSSPASFSSTPTSDCDTAEGSSGAAEFDMPEDFPSSLEGLTILAIHVAGRAEAGREAGFDMEGRASLVIPLVDHFWVAVKSVLSRD